MSNVYIVYSIITLVLFIIIGFCSYIAYDYFTYKNNLNNSLKITTEEINNNFDISSSNLGYIANVTQINKKNIEINKNNLSLLDNYSSNTSNVISMSLNNHKQTISNTFNNFNDNLNRYFAFNDGSANISSSTTNNKIFNYIFGTSIPNINLIAQTTAMSGLTINSDVDKELLICGSYINKDKCIKMMTDTNGNFNISPAGTNNIKFMSNTVGGINNTMINFDTANNKIFLGGANESLSKMYITNEGVYVKDLYFIGNSGNILLNKSELSEKNNNVNTLMNNFSTNIIFNTQTLNIENDPRNGKIISRVFISINIPNGTSITINKNKLEIENISLFLDLSLIDAISSKTYYAPDTQVPTNQTNDYINIYINPIDKTKTGELNNLLIGKRLDYNTGLKISFNSSSETIIPFDVTVHIDILYEGDKGLFEFNSNKEWTTRSRFVV